MIKVMTADDDFAVRNGLSKLIDWNGLGAEVVFSASNGAQIIEAVKKRPVDLIITDIKMPVMDGIELSRYFHEHMPEVQIILLSSFAEFEYARKALSVGVRDYILKPINREKVNKLSNLVREIAEETEFTRYLSAGINNNEFSGRFLNALRQKVGDMPSALVSVPEKYKNLAAYREFCMFLLDALVSHTAGGQNDFQMNLKQILRGELLECTTCRELEERFLQICRRYIGEDAENEHEGGLLERIAAYMQENACDSAITVQSVAERFSLTPDYLSRLFKAETGLLPLEYIINQRLERASYLLVNSRLTLSQIARQCGYEDEKYFIRLFKKKKDITPIQYRQEAAK